MNLLFMHFTAVLCLALGLKDFSDSPLTISGELVVELHGALRLNCSSTCENGRPDWHLRDNSPAETEEGYHSSVLRITPVTRDEDKTTYTCSVKCKQGNKRKQVTVRVYSLPSPAIYSTPQAPQSGQPFKMTCELKDFYPEDISLIELCLFRSQTPIKGLTPYRTNQSTLAVTASDLQERTNTEYKCVSKMKLDGKIIHSDFTTQLVQPQEATTEFVFPGLSMSTRQHQEEETTATAFAVSAEQNTPPYLSTSTSWSVSTEDDLLNPITPMRDGKVLVTLSEMEKAFTEVQTSSTPGGVHRSVGLYTLSTLGVVASFASVGSVLFLIQYRRKKRQQEELVDKDEMEKEKEKQQLPETCPQ